MKFYRNDFSFTDLEVNQELMQNNKVNEFQNDLVNFGFLNTDGSKTFKQRFNSQTQMAYWSLKWNKEPHYSSSKAPDNPNEINSLTLSVPNNSGNNSTVIGGLDFRYASGGSSHIICGEGSAGGEFLPFWFIPLKGGGFLIERYRLGTYEVIKTATGFDGEDSLFKFDFLKYNATPPFLTSDSILRDPHFIFPSETDPSIYTINYNRKLWHWLCVGIPNHFTNDITYFITKSSFGGKGMTIRGIEVKDFMHVNQTQISDYNKIPYIDRTKQFPNEIEWSTANKKYGEYDTYTEWADSYNAVLNKPYETIDINQNVCTLIRMPYLNTFYDNIYLISTAPNDRMLSGQFFSFSGRNFLCIYQNLVVELPAN